MGYTGTFGEGNSVVIDVTGAGTSVSQDTPDVPLLWENFEGVALDAALDGTTPISGSWVFDAPANNNGTYVKNASPAPHGGTKYSQHLATNDGKWWGQFVVPITGSPDKLYHEFWGYVSHVDGINKMMQIHGDANGTDFSPGFHFGSFTHTFTDLDNGTTVDNWGYTWEDVTNLYGEWVLYRVMGAQSGSNIKDGVIKCRATKIVAGVNTTVNLTDPIGSGDPTLDEEACRTRLLDSTSWEEASCNHGASVNMTGTPVTTGVNETWTAKSWARVVITDTATAPDLSVSEDFLEYSIQPITSWTDTAVTITCNQGMLSDFDGSYIHVFDNTNTRIETFLISSITAALTGTLSGSTEADIVTGGKTTIITLADDTWIAAGTGAIGTTAQTASIIVGMISAQSELLGWNNEVTGTLVRDSNTQATITWSASASYDITAQEVLTLTIPADVLTTSTTAIIASPTSTIDTTAASAPSEDDYHPQLAGKLTINLAGKMTDGLV